MKNTTPSGTRVFNICNPLGRTDDSMTSPPLTALREAFVHCRDLDGSLDEPVWGLLAGIFNSIPYYGPLIVTGGLSIVAFLQFGTFSMTAAVAGGALLITTVEGYLVTPALMGKVAEMNRVAVFAGLLFWSWVWGLPGLLLAVPMMMIVKAICDNIEDLKPIGRFLAQ